MAVKILLNNRSKCGVVGGVAGALSAVATILSWSNLETMRELTPLIFYAFISGVIGGVTIMPSYVNRVGQRRLRAIWGAVATVLFSYLVFALLIGAHTVVYDPGTPGMALIDLGGMLPVMVFGVPISAPFTLLFGILGGVMCYEWAERTLVPR